MDYKGGRGNPNNSSKFHHLAFLFSIFLVKTKLYPKDMLAPACYLHSFDSEQTSNTAIAKQVHKVFASLSAKPSCETSLQIPILQLGREVERHTSPYIPTWFLECSWVQPKFLVLTFKALHTCLLSYSATILPVSYLYLLQLHNSQPPEGSLLSQATLIFGISYAWITCMISPLLLPSNPSSSPTFSYFNNSDLGH